jgi:hypothetical protein
MSKPYNGHPSWNAWNVSLWINNDEGLYNMARDYLRRAKRREEAARAMVEALDELGTTETPDGARYTVTNVQRAMRGM